MTDENRASFGPLTRERDGVFRQPERDGKPGLRYIRFQSRIWIDVADYNIVTTVNDDEAARSVAVGRAEVAHQRAIDRGEPPPSYDPNAPPLPEDRRQISIVAPINWPSHRPLSLITEEGLRRYSGRVELNLRGGGREASTISHFEAMPEYQQEEMVFVSISMPLAEIEWLKDELLKRPGARLTGGFRAGLFMNEIDEMAAEPHHYVNVAIEPKRFTDVTTYQFSVSNTLPADRDDDDGWGEESVPQAPAATVQPPDLQPVLLKLLRWQQATLAVLVIMALAALAR